MNAMHFRQAGVTWMKVGKCMRKVHVQDWGATISVWSSLSESRRLHVGMVLTWHAHFSIQMAQNSNVAVQEIGQTTLLFIFFFFFFFFFSWTGLLPKWHKYSLNGFYMKRLLSIASMILDQDNLCNSSRAVIFLICWKPFSVYTRAFHIS